MHRARAVFCPPRRCTKGASGDVVSDTFQLQETGEALTRDYIEHPGAVAILPMNNDGEILLLKQYSHPVGMDLWEIPAGLLDVEGEEFQAGAARELAEEADLSAGTWNVPGRRLQLTGFLERGHQDLPGPRPH
jgi:8-oxo-dGTP pyrophosphatase MutT (NUDIX family)